MSSVPSTHLSWSLDMIDQLKDITWNLWMENWQSMIACVLLDDYDGVAWIWSHGEMEEEPPLGKILLSTFIQELYEHDWVFWGHFLG